MPSDYKDNLTIPVVELENHMYRHFEYQLILWTVRNITKIITDFFKPLKSILSLFRNVS